MVVTPDQPRGIWQVDGVPLAELVDRLREREGEPLSVCGAEMAARLKVEEARLVTALDWLRSRKVLPAQDRVAIDRAAIMAEE